jgi:predicted PurR-regulated permease PerM
MVIRDPWIRALVIVMLCIAAVYLTGLIWQVALQFADVILLFFLAWIISFILEPFVAALHGRTRLPRHLAVLAAYLAVLIAVSVAVLQLVPRLSNQIIQVAVDLPLYVDWANGELLHLQGLLAGQGILVAPETLINYQDAARHIEALGPLLLANTVGLATGVANLLFQIFIVLILSYYMTLDGRRISAALLLAVPGAYRDDARYLFESVNRAFAGFLRGQCGQAAIYGLGTAVVMSVAGMKLVLLSSVLATLFMLIPFIGPFLAIILPLVVAAVTLPGSFLAILVALFLLQQIVVNVIAPRLMSQTVGLHPLLVFFAVLAGAKVAGLWGALFGVPIVGVATAMVSFYRATVEDRRARILDATPELAAAERAMPEVSEPRMPAARVTAQSAAADAHGSGSTAATATAAPAGLREEPH